MGPQLCSNEVSALLIYAIRASFNVMVAGLRRAFDVTLLDDFSFEFEDVGGPPPEDRPWEVQKQRLKSWTLIELSRPGSGEVLPFKIPKT